MRYVHAARGFMILAVFALIFGLPSTGFAQNNNEDDVFVGTVERIDEEAKMIYVKSKDGVVKGFKWTAKTTAHGIKKAAVWTETAALVGAHIVVRSAIVAGEATIKGLHWFGEGTVNVVEATVKHLGKGSKKVAVAVVDGAEETYDVAEHAVVKTGKKIGHGAKFVEKETEKGVQSVVHIVEKDGKKFIHFFEHKPKQ